MNERIGVILSDLQIFNASVCSALYHLSEKNNFELLIELSHENEYTEKDIALRFINEYKVNGLIIMSSCTSIDFYNNLLGINYPVIFIDRLIPYSKFSAVTVDNYGASNKLCKILIDKQIKTVFCLSTLSGTITVEDRINGFRDAHANNQAISCYRFEFDYNNLKEQVNTQVEKWVRENTAPDAIFAVNHTLMSELIKHIKSNSKLSQLFRNTIFSCFDDLPYFDWLDMPIISVKQPIKDIASIALSTIDGKISHALKNNTNVVLPLTIIDRTK